MPSKSAKQHRFMEAIAHSPSFAKKAGVPQSVGKDYAAADKGKKFAGGGKAVINKQDTKHGKMDMPFNKLNRFAGMKTGGMMKKGRRFDTGGDVDAGLSSYAEPQKVEKEATGEDKKQGPLETLKIPKRTSKPTTRRNTERAETGNERRSRLDVSRFRPSLTNQRLSMEEMGIGSGMKKGGSIKRFAAGGMMKESKAMIGKEINFMKKKGAPKSMIKHEAAEMGAMKKGGMPMKDGKPAFMKGMAKGGGIESRGKTKGMMVKMATGGVVKFAKGGGIESKGKTKGTMIKMKGC